MIYGNIKNVNKPVSKIFLGTASKPFMRGQNCDGLLNAALACGINAIDTARVYGRSERAIGGWLKRCDRRNEVVLLSKCCHPNAFGARVTPRAMRADLKKSLAALGTGYIDIYLLHRDDQSTPVGPLVEEFNSMHASGKIGAFGGSNWSYARIAEANEYAYSHSLIPFTVSSPNFSLASQNADIWGGGVSISGDEGRAERLQYKESKMAVVAYSSLARGLFSGRVNSAQGAAAFKQLDKFAVKGYLSEQNLARLARSEVLAKELGATVSQTALAYVLCCGLNSFAVVGSSSAERTAHNVAAADIVLTSEQIARLESGHYF